MLGRTANDLFWLSRYVERAENMARLIEVGYRIALLPRDDEGRPQRGVALDARAAPAARTATLPSTRRPTTRDVINYLLFDCANPSSVQSCLSAARRNGRAQRIALTRDMWESLNGAWIEFSNIKPSEVTANELPRLLDWITLALGALSAARCSTRSCATTPTTSARSAPSSSAPTTPPASST